MSIDFIYQQIQKLGVKFNKKEYISYRLGWNQLTRAYKRENDIIHQLGYNNFSIEVQFGRDRNIKTNNGK